jgi:type IX secretion system PorP/SprF family membrane protein
MKYVINIGLAICALFCFLQNSYAQQLPVYNQYPIYGYLYNPSLSGVESYSTVYAVHRTQWINMPDSPVSSALAFDMPIANQNMGVGAVLSIDRTHVISKFGAAASYAYHIPFSNEIEHKLSLGVMAGIQSQRFNASSALIEDIGDQALFDDDISSVTVDFSLGVNYRNKGLDIGISVPQVMGNSFQYNPSVDNPSKFKLSQHIFGTASYRFEINEDFSVKPVVMARFIPNLPLQVDINVLGSWKKLLSLGVGYRTNNAGGAGVYGLLGVNISDFGIYYSYETIANSEDRGSLGSSHEVSVSYRFGMKKKNDEVEKMRSEIAALNKEFEETAGEINVLDSLASAKVEEALVDIKTDVKATKDGVEELKNKLENLESRMDTLKMGGTTVVVNPDGTTSTTINSSSVKYEKIGTVQFDKGSFVLTPSAQSELQVLADLMKSSDYITIHLQGNASVEGTSESNMTLSVKRAAAVRDYLEQQQVDSDKIVLLPYGEENLSGLPQETESGKANTRRVDIFILK